MSDVGEDYRARDAFFKAKKIDNKEKSIKLLIDNEIDFIEKNNGIHLIVTSFKGTVIDFYPTTGKWIIRGQKASRGVLNLIRFIKNETT